MTANRTKPFDPAEYLDDKESIAASAERCAGER